MAQYEVVGFFFSYKNGELFPIEFHEWRNKKKKMCLFRLIFALQSLMYLHFPMKNWIHFSVNLHNFIFIMILFTINSKVFIFLLPISFPHCNKKKPLDSTLSRVWKKKLKDSSLYSIFRYFAHNKIKMNRCIVVIVFSSEY